VVRSISLKRNLFAKPYNTILLAKIEFANMEKLSNFNSKMRDCLDNIGSIEPKFIEEKMISWSSSILSKLSYHNVRNAFAFIGRTLEPKNLECKILSWSSSVSSYIEANPIIFSVQSGNNIGGDAVQTYVNLPYLGAVSLDIFLFSSSAIISRGYMFCRSRRQSSHIIGGGKTYGNATNKSFRPELNIGPPSPPVKSTIVQGYKDKSLSKTIGECQEVKKSLRRVADPELARKEKKTQLARQNARTKIKGNNSCDEYLGMSPCSLQDARRCLKQVTPDQRQRKTSS
jgi:hypothetical protein